MANKKNWFFGGKSTKKDSEVDSNLMNGLEVNNLTAEMFNISLEITDMTASALNKSSGVGNMTNDTTNAPKPLQTTEVQRVEPSSPPPQNNALNVVQLDTENMVNGGSTPTSKPKEDTGAKEVETPTQPEPTQEEQSSTTSSGLNVVQLDIESIMNDIRMNAENLEEEESIDTEIDLESPLEEVEDTTPIPPKHSIEDFREVTFDYVPLEFRYPSEFKDTIIIRMVTYNIIEDYGETNGLRVYTIRNGNMICKFMWYSKERFENYALAVDTLKYIMKNPKIKELAFIPNDVIENENGFGYLTPLTGKDFHTLKSIVENKHRFYKVSAIENTAINLIKTFKGLDAYGLQLYNFDENNLSINTSNGDIFMDIVSTFTKSTTLEHNVAYEYLAPETNMYGTLNQQSTCHSLMVILFKLLYHDNPLDGHNVVSDVSLTPNKVWYGEKALFNMSCVDTSNHPVRGVHYQLIGLWNKYPNYIKNVFCTFFENSLLNPLERDDYDSILLSFKHLKTMTFSCECGHSDFLQNLRFNGSGFQCSKCGKAVQYMYFDNTRRSIPIKLNSLVYLSFVTRNYDSDSKIGVIVADEEHDNVYALRNLTNIPWNYSSSNGDTEIIQPNGLALLVGETTIDIGYTRILVNHTKL